MHVRWLYARNRVFFVALVMAMLMMIVYMSAIVKFEAGEGVTGGARELVTLSELRLK